MIYWRSKHGDGCSGSSGINQGHTDIVQGIGRTVPVHAVTEMEGRIEGEVMEERNKLGLLKDQMYSIPQSVSDSDLEEGVDEKQHYETEDGVLFTLQRYCLPEMTLSLYPSTVKHNLTDNFTLPHS